MSRAPKIAGFLLVVMLLVVQISHAQAADPPLLIGPDMGVAGENITYAVTNPSAEKLQIFSEGGIWIREIIADNDVSCTLNDQGTLVEIGCNGSFQLTISSSLGQQLRFILGLLTKDVIVTGARPTAITSQVRIYNGAIAPISPLPGSGASKIPTVTNMLVGATSRFLLTTIAVTTSVSDTFNITLTIPQGIVSQGPRDCVLTNDTGVYSCTIGAAQSDWLPSSFNAQWNGIGVYTMRAHGVRSGQDIGSYEHVANVLIVEHMRGRQFLPTIRR